MPQAQAGSAEMNVNLQQILSSAFPQWISVEKLTQAISYINSALQNPLKPTRCAKSLSVALGSFDLIDAVLPEQPISKRATLVSNLYAFLTAKRTDNQLKTMMRKLAICSCKTASDSSGFHDIQIPQPASNVIRDDAQKFVLHAIREIELILNPKDSLPVNKGTSKIWPTCTSDLMPFGADQLVFTILQWYRFFSHPAVVRFALLVLKVCGIPIYGAFNRANMTNTLFLAPMRQCIDEALTYTTPAQLRKFTSLFSYTALNFVRYLVFFGVKMRARGVIAAHGEPFTKGGATKAIQLCSLILYILGSPHVDENVSTEYSLDHIRTDAITVGCIIFRRYKIDHTSGPPMRFHPAIVASDRMHQQHPLTHDRHHIIATAIYICRFYYICAAPGCKDCFTNPDAQLRSCSGCSTVRYCGQECQTKDWKEEPYKHKKLCKILSTIMAAFGSWKLAPLGNLSDKPFDDHRANDLKRRRDFATNLRDVLLRLSLQHNLSEEDVLFTWEWAKTIADADASVDERPIVERHPGYKDYEELLQRVEKSPLFRAPKAEPMSQIAK